MISNVKRTYIPYVCSSLPDVKYNASYNTSIKLNMLRKSQLYLSFSDTAFSIVSL